MKNWWYRTCTPSLWFMRWISIHGNKRQHWICEKISYGRRYINSVRDCLKTNGTNYSIGRTLENLSTSNLPQRSFQASSLGPLVFLIYRNELHDRLMHSHVQHFAHDIGLIDIQKMGMQYLFIWDEKPVMLK